MNGLSKLFLDFSQVPYITRLQQHLPSSSEITILMHIIRLKRITKRLILLFSCLAAPFKFLGSLINDRKVKLSLPSDSTQLSAEII